MTLTYKVPKPPKTPFQRGEMVEVLDREHKVISTQKVIYAGKRIVRTACGRRWDAKSGWWIGDEAWPFPSIRKAKS